MKAWLQSQPREVSVAFAARAALRVLPIVQEALRYKPNDIILRVFGNLAFAWIAARYSLHPKGYAPPTIDLGAFGLASSAATSAGMAAHLARGTVSKPNLSAEVFRCADDAFASTRALSPPTPPALARPPPLWPPLLNARFGLLFPSTRPAWKQARRLPTSLVRLRPQGQPDWLQSLWREVKDALLAANQDWGVWIHCYDLRLSGHVRGEAIEFAYVRIEEALWNQGPAIVNAEIRKRLAEEIENVPADNPPFGPQSSAAANAILAAWQPDDQGVVQLEASGQIALRGRAGPLNTAALNTHALNTLAPNQASTGISAALLSTTGVVEPVLPIEAIPPEPSSEPGPILQVTERGLEIISQPIGTDFDETLQKALHDRLRRLLSTLKDATARVANAHPALDHLVSEYSDLIAQPFDQLDVGSLWAVGTGLLAFRAAFTSQLSGTMTEPLEPHHLALLQQAAEIHGGFILGFPKGRELTERADHARLSPEIIAQIAPPTHRIIDGLANARDFVETRTRKFLAAVDESFFIHGWETARTGHAAYAATRNSLIALGKVLIRANSILGQWLGDYA